MTHPNRAKPAHAHGWLTDRLPKLNSARRGPQSAQSAGTLDFSFGFGYGLSSLQRFDYPLATAPSTDKLHIDFKADLESVTMRGLHGIVLALVVYGHPSMAENPNSDSPPDWLRESTLYELDASRFYNGERANDSQGSTLGDNIGADFHGIKAKLPYLRELGVNAIILRSVFSCEGKHVLPSLGTGNASSTDWDLDPNDRVFIDLLEVAHQSGFRVVAELPMPQLPAEPEEGLSSFLIKVARRWLDPNEDGKFSDGLDGWVVYSNSWPPEFAKQWRADIKKLNPGVVILDGTSEPNKRLAGLADMVIDYRLGDALIRFLGSQGDTSSKSLLAEFQSITESGNVHPILTAHALRGPESTRIRSALAPSGDAKLARLNLAIIVQHFLPGAPLTLFGDEVGMTGSVRGAAPMWWADPPDSGSKSPEFRPEILGLVRWLHSRRAIDEPMARGSFRTVLVDDEKQLFAFGRTLGKDETILLINYGTTKQKAVIAGNWAGKTVGVLIPSVQAPQATRPKPGEAQKPPADGPMTFRVNGNRQFVGDDGEVSVPIGGLSARVILIREGELR